jgi:hypothetical protein
MRVACSFVVLSALLLFSNSVQSAAQSKPDTKDQQPAQKPEATPQAAPALTATPNLAQDQKPTTEGFGHKRKTSRPMRNPEAHGSRR